MGLFKTDLIIWMPVMLAWLLYGRGYYLVELLKISTHMIYFCWGNLTFVKESWELEYSNNHSTDFMHIGSISLTRRFLIMFRAHIACCIMLQRWYMPAHLHMYTIRQCWANDNTVVQTLFQRWRNLQYSLWKKWWRVRHLTAKAHEVSKPRDWVL